MAASCYRKYQPIKDEVVWFTSTQELQLLHVELWPIMRMVVFVFVIPFKICFQQLHYLVIKSITVIMYEYADGLKAELVPSFATLGFLDKIQLCKRRTHLESLYM